MGPKEAITTCLRKSFVGSGRASQSEFWWFWLAHVLVPWIAALLALFLVSVNGMLAGILFYGGVAMYFLTIPSTYCAVVRRFHDTGRTGKWSALFIIAVAIIAIVLLLLVGFVMNSMTVDAIANPSAALYALPGLMGFDAIVFSVLFFIVLAPLLLVALILFAILTNKLSKPSQPGPNKYGPNPHEVSP